MISKLPSFNPGQWLFLSILDALGGKASVDLLIALAPLSAGELLDLVRQGESSKLLYQNDNNHFFIGSQLPPHIKHKLQSMNTAEQMKMVQSKIEEQDFMDGLPPEIVIRLLILSRRNEEAAMMEAEMAQEALQNSEMEEARRLLLQALTHLRDYLGITENDALFIRLTLLLSKTCWILGKNFGDIPPMLADAKTAADRMGDKRSRALINLHLGLLFYYGDRRLEAMEVFAEGKAMIEELGDDDILIESAEYLCFYYYLQGDLRQAMEVLERAIQNFETSSGVCLLNPIAPFFFGFGMAFLCQFDRGIGCIDYAWRRAKHESLWVLATTYRATLGVLLLNNNEMQEAYYHLKGALEAALAQENSLAQYTAESGIASYFYLLGQPEKAREWLEKMVMKDKRSGLIRQIASPWMLEMLFEFDRLGLDPIPGFDFQNQFARIMREQNVHLQGAALRMSSQKALGEGKNPLDVLHDLEKSEEMLHFSGDPMQLAKTRIEMALLKLSLGERDQACLLAQKARKGLSGNRESYFPDGLRSLLESDERTGIKNESKDSFSSAINHLKTKLIYSPDLDKVLASIASTTNRFFKAERGGIFWTDKTESGNLYLRVGRNLSRREVSFDAFRSNMSHVQRCYDKNLPQVIRNKRQKIHPFGQRAYAQLCIPLRIENRIAGVLYHDNSYIDDCFEAFTESQLKEISDQLSRQIGYAIEYRNTIEQATREAQRRSAQIEQSNSHRMISQSQTMSRILTQADIVAESESTVLILGETGVGKELLARRLHQNSPRRKGPFVIVDISTIPENLMESELFGHEKGAFTGADRRKPGRIELADNGTLFIDEIGDISLSMQVKLLRVLQEKTFVRVGGQKQFQSDFRLVTATNRDLAAEVEAGRFRKDLYYRINIVALELPPLRERSKDILHLSQYFLERYAKKYNRQYLELSPEDVKQLNSYSWPGNVRELQNVIERAVLLSDGKHLELNLPPKASPFNFSDSAHDIPTLDEVERRYILQVLELTNGRISGIGGAAERTGLKRTSFYRKMEKLGIQNPRKIVSV